jgi:hypothetical protein
VIFATIAFASEDALVSILISFTILFESWPATRPAKPVKATTAAEAMEKNFMAVESGGVGVMRRLAVGGRRKARRSSEETRRELRRFYTHQASRNASPFRLRVRRPQLPQRADTSEA